jgi:putative ABC transport system substrate-binding protein
VRPPNSRGIGGKWLELLKEVAPRATRIAVLRDSTVAAGPGQFGAVQGAGASKRWQDIPA